MKIFLRANERIFINGAVLRVDRKVSLELMNDATFLLENHVLQQEDATTPLKQLYYVVQLMLMDPSVSEDARVLFKDMVKGLLDSLENRELVEGVKAVDIEVSTGKNFQALKTLRGLFDIEADVLDSPSVGAAKFAAFAQAQGTEKGIQE
ncbi:flagellar biosynthesis repressor FlbT [Salaquimonas pukyongi]|uniref:flagellar biosynthesis repressor FlbT n=1 Tax=Salaquimonas pukyongi TaxID=2712698 RepID=UPI00096B9680|nr:flagellar biosynthesis repressor FlbT [Salaquimonas pukyongi]